MLLRRCITLLYQSQFAFIKVYVHTVDNRGFR
jgi:hypothetical protein